MSERGYGERIKAPPKTTPSEVQRRREHAKASSQSKLGGPSSGNPKLATAVLSAFRSVVRIARREWALLMVIGSYLTYTATWTYIGIMRVLSMNAGVYDLGVYSQLGWGFIHSSGSSLSWNIQYFLSTQGLVPLMAPIAATGDYYLLIGLQAAAFGSSGLIIYAISKRVLKDSLTSVLLSVSFFIYFASAGETWFDLHYEVLFVPLFLGGYLLVCKEKWILAGCLFLLSGIAVFPFELFSIILGLVSILLLSRCSWARLKCALRTSAGRFYLGLTTASSIILLWSYWFRLQYAALAIASTAHTGTTLTPLSNLDDKLFTLCLICVPFLGRPLSNLKSLALLSPYIFILVMYNYWAYMFPAVLYYQYSELFLAPMFIGAIESLSMSYRFLVVRSESGMRSHDLPDLHMWRNHSPRQDATRIKTQLSPRSTFRRVRSLNRLQRESITILAISLLLASMYEPYGPLNAYSGANFQVGSELGGNVTLFHEFEHLVSLIPRNDPYVLFQNNMPELLPRPLAYDGTPLIPGVTVAYNLTHQLLDGKWVRVRVDYIIADPFSYTFTWQNAFPYNISMLYVVQKLYSTQRYGIVGEADGMLVLGANYTGPIQYYSPDDQYIPASELSITNSAHRDGPLIIGENVTGGATLWYGPYASFPPGMYNISLELLSTSNSSQDTLQSRISDLSRNLIFNLTTITGSDFIAGRWTNMTIPLYLNNFYNGVEFAAQYVTWEFGSIELKSVTVSQVGPGNTTYLVSPDSEGRFLTALPHFLPVGSKVLVPPGILSELTVPAYTSYDCRNTSSWPTYILVDPYDVSFFDTTPCSNFTSMYVAVQAMYASGQYGVLAENRGITLLARNESGTPLQFSPDDRFFPATSLLVPVPSYREGSLIVGNNISGDATLWYGPYVFLPPGRYVVSFELLTTTNSSSDTLQLRFSDLSQGLIFKLTTISGSQIPTGKWTNVTVRLHLGNFYSGVEFAAQNVVWTEGSLLLSGISVYQTSPS